MQFKFKIDDMYCTVVVTDYTLGDEDFFECDYKVYDPDQEELKPQFISDFFHDWIVDEILDRALEEEKHRAFTPEDHALRPAWAWQNYLRCRCP